MRHVNALQKHLQKAARARWAAASDEERKRAASKAGKAFWAGLSKDERSQLMKERAKRRKRSC